MVAFKSIFITPITLILVCGSVIAVEDVKPNDKPNDKPDGIVNNPLSSDAVDKPSDGPATNNNQVQDVSGTDGLIQEFKRLIVSNVHSFDFLYSLYIRKLMMDKKNDGHTDYIKEKNDKMAKLSSRFGEIMIGFKLDKRHKMLENLDELTDNLIAYKEFLDEVYDKLLGVLDPEEFDGYKYDNTKIKSLKLFVLLNSWKIIMNILNETFPADDNKFSMKEFDEHKSKVVSLNNKIDKKEGDYKANFNDMKEEVSRATKEFNRCIDSTVDNIGEYGIYIDSGIISSIKTLADTIANISYTLIPGLMTISITSLIYLIF